MTWHIFIYFSGHFEFDPLVPDPLLPDFEGRIVDLTVPPDKQQVVKKATEYAKSVQWDKSFVLATDPRRVQSTAIECGMYDQSLFCGGNSVNQVYHDIWNNRNIEDINY